MTLSEDNKELIREIKKLTNSIDKLTILFEFVKKELVEDYDNKDNSEALLKKLLNQNQVIAQGMVKLSDSVNNHSNQQPQKTQSSSNIQNNQAQPNKPSTQLHGNVSQQNKQQTQPLPNKHAPSDVPPPPNNQQSNSPQMDFTNFKSLNDSKQPGLEQKIPEPKEEKKGFLGMFKK